MDTAINKNDNNNWQKAAQYHLEAIRRQGLHSLNDIKQPGHIFLNLILDCFPKLLVLYCEISMNDIILFHRRTPLQAFPYRVTKRVFTMGIVLIDETVF